jgi:hypothetical protein
MTELVEPASVGTGEDELAAWKFEVLTMRLGAELVDLGLVPSQDKEAIHELN